MANLQSLFDLADPRVREIWDEKSSQLSSTLEYQSVFGYKEKNAEILNTVIENFTGLGLASLTGEKQAYSNEEIVPGSSITVTPQKWTQSIDITEEMLRFNLWDKINNLTSAVGNSLFGRIDTEAAKLFYLGFGTTFQTGGDSLSLFNSAHTQTGNTGTSQSNTTTNTLSYENLKTAVQAMDRFQDDKGIQLRPCRKLRLIVAREKQERATEVLRSIGNPDNGNRVSNVFANGDGYIELRTAHWVPSTTYGNYWFLVDMERAQQMLHLLWGWKPRFDSDNVVNNGTKVYVGSTMFKPAFSSWQFAYGANATS